MNNVTAILLCAGNSSRYGKGINKNFELINNKYIFCYSLDIFDSNSYIDDIIIVIKEKDKEFVQNIINKNNYKKNIKIIIGGNSRNESVYNAINNTLSKYVLIHDGARPLIKHEYINKCIESIKNYNGVCIGVKSKDTIKICNDNNEVINTTERCNTWIISTPQCFNRKILLESHKKNKLDNITDDCMLLENNNYKVKVIEGDYSNIKITTQNDLEIVKSLIE